MLFGPPNQHMEEKLMGKRKNICRKGVETEKGKNENSVP